MVDDSRCCLAEQLPIDYPDFMISICGMNTFSEMIRSNVDNRDTALRTLSGRSVSQH